MVNLLKKYFFSLISLFHDFLNHDTINTLDQIILCGGDCLIHCRMFSNIPGLYPPVASNTLSTSPQPKQSLDTVNYPLGDKTDPLLRATALSLHKTNIKNKQAND